MISIPEINKVHEDERILEDVSERLMRHGQLDASDIEVAVANGDVSLEDIAASVPGVNNLHNRLKLSH